MPRSVPHPGYEPALIRTDFSDDAAWQALCDYLLTERLIDDVGERMSVAVIPVDDRQYEGMTMEELLELVPNNDPEDLDDIPISDSTSEEDNFARHAYQADSMTFTHPDRPLMAVNYYLTHGEHFRLAAKAMVMVEANLSIANLGFDEYVNSTSDDGIHRGF